MDNIASAETKTSKKSIIKAAVFGLILGFSLDCALKYTISFVLITIQEVNNTAQLNYESFSVLGLLIPIIISFFVAFISGFLAGRKGVLVGLLANSVYIITSVGILIFAILNGIGESIGNISFQFYSFVQLLLILFVSILGGVLGERIYSPEKDLNLESDELPILGIRWAHCFWFLPLVFLPFFTAFIVILYAGACTCFADLYFVVHPSLWIRLSCWFCFFISLMMMCEAVRLMGSFFRFCDAMQYSSTELTGWEDFKQVILHGIGAPLLSCCLAAFAAMISHNIVEIGKL